MKKYFFSLLVLFFGLVGGLFSAQASPTLEVQLAPGNHPTQRITPGEQSIELLRIWLTPQNHESSMTTLRKLKFEHFGDETDHFLRYNLMQDNRILGRLSLTGSDIMEFSNLNIELPDDKTAQLRILGDVATHSISGTHWFGISHPDFLTLEKEDIRHDDTYITGDFPIESNKIIIAENFDRPEPDCNLREEPVCGVDGLTYYNLCIPFQKGIEIDYPGPCYESPVIPPDPCPEDRNPVCGDNNRTYHNQCMLDRAEGINRAYDGECFPRSFQTPQTFQRAVELFDLKANQLKQIRPSLDPTTEVKLDELGFVLHSYAFTADNTRTLTHEIGDFLEYASIPSDRTALTQAIQTLNKSIIDARTDSARQKYVSGIIPFRDTDENAWYLPAVKFLKDNNWLKQLVDHTDRNMGFFRPEYFVTKAEVTQILLNLAEIDTFVSPPPQNPFARNHWAYNTIAKAEELGLSLWADLPNPDQKITRLEVTQLILEIFKDDIKESYTVSAFKDVTDREDISIVEHARNLRLINGYPDGSFRPKRLITRSEAAQLILNASNIFVK